MRSKGSRRIKKPLSSAKSGRTALGRPAQRSLAGTIVSSSSKWIPLTQKYKSKGLTKDQAQLAVKKALKRISLPLGRKIADFNGNRPRIASFPGQTDMRTKEERRWSTMKRTTLQAAGLSRNHKLSDSSAGEIVAHYSELRQPKWDEVKRFADNAFFRFLHPDQRVIWEKKLKDGIDLIEQSTDSTKKLAGQMAVKAVLSANPANLRLGLETPNKEIGAKLDLSRTASGSLTPISSGIERALPGLNSYNSKHGIPEFRLDASGNPMSSSQTPRNGISLFKGGSAPAAAGAKPSIFGK